MSLFNLTKTASVMVDDIDAQLKYDPFLYGRTKYSVLSSTMAELGELAEEVMIERGNSYKGAGVDGIIGEAVDTIVCLLDLIHLANPDMTEQELDEIALKKLNKWVTKVSERVK
jgi:NTP pyrophosphatase (non-canonical NTP hydrolase)